MKSENVWTGMPALSSVGFNRANWMEGMPPDREGMLIRATGLRSIGCSLQKCEIRVYALAERVFLECEPWFRTQVRRRPKQMANASPKMEQALKRCPVLSIKVGLKRGTQVATCQ